MPAFVWNFEDHSLTFKWNAYGVCFALVFLANTTSHELLLCHVVTFVYHHAN